MKPRTNAAVPSPYITLTHRGTRIHSQINHSLEFALGVSRSFSGLRDACGFLCKRFCVALDKTICLRWKRPHTQRSIWCCWHCLQAHWYYWCYCQPAPLQLHRMQKTLNPPPLNTISLSHFLPDFCSLFSQAENPVRKFFFLHGSKQHSEIHSPCWGCRHQRAHKGWQQLNIQGAGAAVRRIDWFITSEKGRRWRECKDRSSAIFTAWMHHNKDGEPNPQSWVQINSIQACISMGNICSCPCWLSASAISRKDRLFCSRRGGHTGGRAADISRPVHSLLHSPFVWLLAALCGMTHLVM